ncbi:MAG: hypothetical protein Q9209_002854 [Squamulea sp. 1 TL-2023]
MTRYNIALLSLIASTAYAVPHYGQYGHKHPVHHNSGLQPSGVLPSGSGGFPTGGPTAPYGTGNSTTLASTGSAPATSNPVITSVVTVVPQPEPTTSKESPIQSSDSSPIGGTSAAGGECGPATITVTSQDTVTVTVSASSSESVVQSSSAPYGNGTSTAPLGTGTAPAYTSSVIPEETSLPLVVSPTQDSSSAVIQLSSVASPSPLVSSLSDTSSETPTTTSVGGGEFYQAPTTQDAIPSPLASTIESSTEENTSIPEIPQSPSTPSTDNSPKENTSTPEIPNPSIPSTDSSPEENTSTPETPKSPSTPSTDNVVARGLVYNEASLTSHFSNTNIGWLYNWDSAPGGQIDSSKEFVPMLWNTSEVYHVPHWNERADAAIAAGTKHLLAFNEPDLPAQANMDVSQSVAGWLDYMEPFHTKYKGDVKLGSPSVCNGPEQHLGLSYLEDFLSQCGGCHVDFIAIHWYGLASKDGVQHLKDHIGKAKEVANGRPIWLTEFKPDGSDEQQAEFLGEILPWLDDKNNGVDRYAYFRVDSMVEGQSLTKAGSAYAA